MRKRFDSPFNQDFKSRRNGMLGLFLCACVAMFFLAYYRETYMKPSFMAKCTTQNTYGECELIWSNMNASSSDD